MLVMATKPERKTDFKGSVGITSFSVTVFVLIVLFASSMTWARTCYCNSCASCNAAFNNASCNVVQMTQSFNDTSGLFGACVLGNGLSNKVFNCAHYTISNGEAYTFELVSSSNITIANCTLLSSFSYPWFPAIYIYSGKGVSLDHITVNHYGMGISMVSSNSNTFNDLNISANLIYGIYLVVSNNNVLNNIVSDFNAYHGIDIYGVHGSYTQGCYGNHLSNYVGEWNGYDGIVLDWQGHDNVFTNITCSHNNRNGMYLFGDHNNITNAVFVDNAQRGIAVLPTSHDNRIKNAIFLNNTRNNILFQSALLYGFGASNNTVINTTACGGLGYNLTTYTKNNSAIDSRGNVSNKGNNPKFITDSTYCIRLIAQPYFVPPTPPNATSLKTNSFTVNVTTPSSVVSNVSLNLYVNDTKLTTVTCAFVPCTYTLRNISLGIYKVNATAFYDGVSLSTPTRTFYYTGNLSLQTLLGETKNCTLVLVLHNMGNQVLTITTVKLGNEEYEVHDFILQPRSQRRLALVSADFCQYVGKVVFLPLTIYYKDASGLLHTVSGELPLNA